LVLDFLFPCEKQGEYIVMSFNIGPVQTFNFTQYGNTGTDSKGKNFYLQMNDGVGQQSLTIDEKTMSSTQKGILATDKGDTITLSGNWTETGYQTVENGPGGKVYTSNNGSSILISGDATIKVDNPNPTPKANFNATADQVKADIGIIEDNNPLGAKEKFVQKGEIEKALKDGKIDQARVPFWQSIVDHFSDYDNKKGWGGTAGANDNLIGFEDIEANTPLASA
jgi:hypothetical protein